jgi:hypothetical protein
MLRELGALHEVLEAIVRAKFRNGRNGVDNQINRQYAADQYADDLLLSCPRNNAIKGDAMAPTRLTPSCMRDATLDRCRDKASHTACIANLFNSRGLKRKVLADGT